MTQIKPPFLGDMFGNMDEAVPFILFIADTKDIARQKFGPGDHVNLFGGTAHLSQKKSRSALTLFVYGIPGFVR